MELIIQIHIFFFRKLLKVSGHSEQMRVNM